MSNALSEWTTFGIGGNARNITVARTRESLIESAANSLVIGRGSKLLVSDDGYDGSITVNRSNAISVDPPFITAQSGADLSKVCAVAAEFGLSGLEWACGIPASVGGAVKMNAGAFGKSVADVLCSAEVFSAGKLNTFGASELGLGYRTSDFSGTVISATFLLYPRDASEIKAKMNEHTLYRLATQPRARSAGSVFKNPRGVKIGQVLDEAGLKGCRRGGAMISREHANIIVNLGGGRARDVKKLIELMKGELLSRGISASEEIIYLGEFA